MRKPILGTLLAAAALAAPAAGQAPPVKITAVNVGLPPGRFVGERDETGAAAHVVKNNTWAPVYVDLEIVKEVKRKAALVVETKESDDLFYTVHVPLPDLSSMPPGTRISRVELPRLPYIRPGGRGEDVTVSVRVPDTSDPSSWRMLSEVYPLRYLHTRDVAKYIVLSLGTKLPGFELPKEAVPEDANNNADTGRALRNGRLETAAITEVALMPDKWFGYEAADLVVLTTGAVDVNNFLNPLFTDPAHRPRLDALLEWVRRGGRLVVSVGSNAQLVSQYDALKDVLPAALDRADPVTPTDELNLDWFSAGRRERLGVLQPRAGAKIPVAHLAPKPGQAFRTLVPPAETGGDELDPRRRVAVQAPFGAGRVTLVAIDLDRSPFLEFASRAEFWNVLLKEAGAAKASVGSTRQRNNVYYGAGSQSDTEDELATEVRTHIDTFEGVPVISFGWVAVFILLYTLLIGPVEYFILKKVFKRLELTWITFPIIVLTVSAIAYFTAYSLKGNDLKINKMDLVDVDPASNRVYGHTWFTVFSPRIETYTVGTEPAVGWAAGDVDQPSPLVDGFGGTRSGRGGLFSRRFRYHCDPDTGALADGMIGVPIQVWSTKAFAADWSARTDRAAPPVVSNLIHPPARREGVSGTFTANLPVKELRDVRLIYAGKAYRYDNPITPGSAVNVFLDPGKIESDWLRSPTWGTTYVAPVTTPGRAGGAAAPGFTPMSLLRVMFHEAATQGDEATATLANASFRRLDQSWRLSPENRDEVIVVGRVEPTAGPAEAIMTEPNSPSPTKLWLKGLPGTGQTREPVPGTLRQETFVRIYVPVQPAAKK